MGKLLGYIVLALLGVVLAILGAVLHDRLKVSGRISLGVGGTIVALVFGYAVVQVWMDDISASPSVGPSATAPVSASAEPSEGEESPSPEASTSEPPIPSASPAPSTPREESESAPAATIYYLADIYPVATEKENRPGRCTGGCTGFGPRSARIGTNVYPKSYVMGNDGDGRRSVATWNTARNCSRLEMTVGVDNSTVTRSRFTFTISRDGEPPKELATTGLADPYKVSAELDGVTQIQIAAYVSGAEAEGVKMVLGDAVLTCFPGSLDR
ncbi:MAG: NPCBM/NEW2 domain-containing protein [Micropruina sp.]|uniref:NPCBM/NEW2 domain-containing protein n=1 Tax=Micropruina sp. TaxID=2737536 RepID=UPI0039E534D9